MTTIRQPRALTAKEAFTRLREHGYPKTFINKLLPEWWSDDVLRSSSGAMQFALLIQQRLGLKVAFSDAGKLVLSQHQSHARFKKRADTQEAELQIAKSLAKASAALAVAAAPPFRDFPNSAIELHQRVVAQSPSKSVTFPELVQFCWQQGLPVLRLALLPQGSKRMAGMALIIQGRPAIVLGHSHQNPSRQLFVLAHEIGHVLGNHIPQNGEFVDEVIDRLEEHLEEDALETQDVEREADELAAIILRGSTNAPPTIGNARITGAELAANAVKLGKQLGIAPGHLILCFGFESKEWATATTALKFVEQNDAEITLQQNYQKFVTRNLLTEDDQKFLGDVQGYALD